MTQGMASSFSAGSSDEQARLRLKGLQHEVEQTETIARWLRRLAILLTILLIACVIGIYLYHVMQYAAVTSITAAGLEGRPGAAEIEYVPASLGKIDFVRESDGLVQTLSEHAADPSSGDANRRFTWSGKKGEKSSLSVTYRSGLFLVTRDLPVEQAASKR